ncbi:MAG: hypothetical protein FWF01_03205, partial [Alphaproteobacteria bacterium]|nr:hypothetical protein [Alphaproteobacteria bacterium]
DPVRIVMVSDLELRHGVLGSLSPYFDFNVGLPGTLGHVPGTLANSVGMVGDLIFREHPQQQRIHFGDGGTVIRHDSIDTGTMVLNEITSYPGTNPNLPGFYTINMATGRIHMRQIQAEGDMFVQGNVTADNDMRAQSFWIRQLGVPAGSAPGDLPFTDADIPTPQIIGGGGGGPDSNNDWEIITQGRDIQRVRNITATGEIAGNRLIMAEGLNDNNAVHGASGQTSVVTISPEGNIWARGQDNPDINQRLGIRAEGRVEGHIFSTLNSNPGASCIPGQVARWGGDGGATLTCFNGEFTKTHPFYECPRHSRLVQRPAWCATTNNGLNNCITVPSQPNDPILCEVRRFFRAQSYNSGGNDICIPICPGGLVNPNAQCWGGWGWVSVGGWWDSEGGWYSDDEWMPCIINVQCSPATSMGCFQPRYAFPIPRF